jgi:hypothetical protein
MSRIGPLANQNDLAESDERAHGEHDEDDEFG